MLKKWLGPETIWRRGKYTQVSITGKYKVSKKNR